MTTLEGVCGSSLIRPGSLLAPSPVLLREQTRARGLLALARSAEMSDQGTAKQVRQVLDYIAVDYAGAVSHGAVVKDSAYAEMKEY
jgi:hypothetical protein